MRKVLAASIGVVLVAALISPSLSTNSFAQSVSSESRILLAILGLTEVIKSHTEELVDTTENIEDDLEFKKKFYELGDGPFPVSTGVLGGRLEVELFVDSCNLPEETACAFNVESIQIDEGGGNVTGIVVDGVFTGISGKEVSTPTNLLVDSGIGKIGASQSVRVVIFIPPSTEFSTNVSFDGEKPQGLELGIRAFAIA
jgi:hypothetical protein